jgi:KDO2-lipid IV(A) lauroyltransferase
LSQRNIHFFKNIRYILEFLPFLPLCIFVKLLPHSCLFVLSAFAGRILYIIPYFGKLVKTNLKVAFPEKDDREINKIALNSISNLILTGFEFIWFSNKTELVGEYIDFDQNAWDSVKKGMDSGKGLIYVAPHLGNWELAGLMIKHYGKMPFAVVARKMNNPYLNWLLNSRRSCEGNMVIPSKGSVRGMIKALKEGYFLATLIDQNTKCRNGGIFVNFFGLPVPTSPAPAFFAKKFDVPVVVGGCIREGRRYKAFCKGLPKAPSEYESEEKIIQELMKITEEFVRQYPDQYLWFYKRFQYIPKDADEELIKRFPAYSSIAPERFYVKDHRI